jgi:hypothetical protein
MATKEPNFTVQSSVPTETGIAVPGAPEGTRESSFTDTMHSTSRPASQEPDPTVAAVATRTEPLGASHSQSSSSMSAIGTDRPDANPNSKP